jgi:hypothetical protein
MENSPMQGLIKVYEDLYVNPTLNPVQTISIEDYYYEGGDGVRYWNITITYFKKNLPDNYFEQLIISPKTSKPELLYDKLETMGHRLGLIKISPILYINKELQVHTIYINGTYDIRIIFDTDHDVIVDKFNTYESAINFIKTFMDV